MLAPSQFPNTPFLLSQHVTEQDKTFLYDALKLKTIFSVVRAILPQFKSKRGFLRMLSWQYNQSSSK